MSRIGSKPIEIPEGVEVSIHDRTVSVKGERGELSFTPAREVSVAVENGAIICTSKGSGKRSKALWGTCRARLNNMVVGVTEGFSKELEMHGVGYRAAMKGSNIELNVGFSHSVTISPPEGIAFSVEDNVIRVEGFDKQVVGQVAADIRAVRKPEPYKGKGVRYKDEQVRRKVGKVVGAVG